MIVAWRGFRHPTAVGDSRVRVLLVTLTAMILLAIETGRRRKFREEMKLGLFFEAFNMLNTGNFGNSFEGTVGSPNFKKPVNFFGATGFSEPIGIPFQAQFGLRFSF